MARERNKGDRVVRVRQAVIDWFLLFGAAAVLPAKPLGSTGEETTFRAQTASSFSLFQSWRQAVPVLVNIGIIGMRVRSQDSALETFPHPSTHVHLKEKHWTGNRQLAAEPLPPWY